MGQPCGKHPSDSRRVGEGIPDVLKDLKSLLKRPLHHIHIWPMLLRSPQRARPRSKGDAVG